MIRHDFVLEVLSQSTRNRDLGIKRETYLNMGVREYWTFDPTLKWIPDGVRGLTLRTASRGRRYETVAPLPGSVHRPSEVLGLHFRAEEPREDRGAYVPGYRCLRIFDPVTGMDLESAAESKARADRETRRADRESRRADNERQRADAAEAELARLRELLRDAKRR